MEEESAQIASSSVEEHAEISDPPLKKLKLESNQDSTPKVEEKSKSNVESVPKLEERLGGILSCTVCLDLPGYFIYQCVNGHLMCDKCFEHLLADARLKDESSTCPNCRVEISKSTVTRNLAVEKAVAELPAACKFCRNKFQRSTVKFHEENSCEDRNVTCTYQIIGCAWKGPFHEVSVHEKQCSQPSCEGRKILPYLRRKESTIEEEKKFHMDVLSFLSCEKITFVDLQLRAYRTDEFVHRLMYDTQTFNALSCNWCVKLSINKNERDAHLSNERTLSYQIISKSKLTSPLLVKFFVAKGPYGITNINPVVYSHEFSEAQIQSQFVDLHLQDRSDCNKLIALRIIDLRLFMAVGIR